MESLHVPDSPSLCGNWSPQEGSRVPALITIAKWSQSSEKDSLHLLSDLRINYHRLTQTVHRKVLMSKEMICKFANILILFSGGNQGRPQRLCIECHLSHLGSFENIFFIKVRN